MPRERRVRVVPLQALVIDPSEGKDVADVIMRRVDDIQRAEGRSVPNANRPVPCVWTSVRGERGRESNGPEELMSHSRALTICRARTAPVWPLSRARRVSVLRSQTCRRWEGRSALSPQRGRLLRKQAREREVSRHRDAASAQVGVAYCATNGSRSCSPHPFLLAG